MKAERAAAKTLQRSFVQEDASAVCVHTVLYLASTEGARQDKQSPSLKAGHAGLPVQ